MGDFNKHAKLLKEKLVSLVDALNAGRPSVVGDLALKVVEQALEAHAAILRRHLGSHEDRKIWAENKYHNVAKLMRELFTVYGELGYEGLNGIRAKKAYGLVKSILKKIQDDAGIDFGIKDIK